MGNLGRGYAVGLACRACAWVNRSTLRDNNKSLSSQTFTAPHGSPSMTDRISEGHMPPRSARRSRVWPWLRIACFSCGSSMAMGIERRYLLLITGIFSRLITHSPYRALVRGSGIHQNRDPAAAAKGQG